AIVYDPELDLLYIGVGNGGPWNEKYRSPKGGENLFTCSVVALKPDTGEYVWHYQENAADDWDYDSAEQMILADIPIEGKQRKVLLHAPKNGFFYVIDRKSGALISAKPFTFINWATGIDMKTGRPIESAAARYPQADSPPIVPGPLGAHSWQPMSYSPLTGLTYIPVNEVGFNYKSQENFEFKNSAMNFGIDMVAAGMPQDPKIKKAILDSVRGKLVAWDPVLQKQAWAVERPGPWNGGTLATAGNLVFEGTAAGRFEAYRADTGEKVWSFDAQTGVMAGPVTYTVNGEQYVAVLAGWRSFPAGHRRGFVQVRKSAQCQPDAGVQAGWEGEPSAAVTARRTGVESAPINRKSRADSPRRSGLSALLLGMPRRCRGQRWSAPGSSLL